MPHPIPFHVGDKVVYPNHGVGIVELISQSGADGEYYRLHLPASKLHVLVPLANAATVGLRPVSLLAELQPILSFLEQHPPDGVLPHPRGDWKVRFRENADKLRGGSLREVAEVLKGLAQLHHDKHLSFREKKMLDRAALLLIDELASAEELTFAAASQRVRGCLAKADLELPPFDEEIEAAS